MAGYIGSKTSVTVVSTETDSRYVNVAGDTMTGALAVNGDLTVDTNTLFVDAANNRVGVGTVIPPYQLTVQPSSGNAQLGIRTNDTTSLAQLIFGRSDDANRGGIYYDMTEEAIEIHAGNTGEKLRITSDGKVGIGTTSPQDALHIAKASAVLRIEDTDTSHISTIQSGASGLIISADATNTVASSFLALNVDATERMRIISDGKVGIGTDSPDGRLHVLNGSAGAVTANGNADDLVIENSGTGGLSILTPDASTSYIIFGSASDNEGAIVRYNQSGALMTIGTEIAGGQLAFRTASGTERMRIDASGNVGIGGTVDNHGGYGRCLQITGTEAAIELESGASYGYLAQNGTSMQFRNVANGSMLLYTNNTERMRIDSSGVVLVGSTSTAGGLSGSALQVGSGHSGITNTGSLVAPSILSSGSLEFNFDGVSGTQRHGRITGNGTTDGGAYAGGLDFEYYAFSGTAYQWYTGMRITSAGNVGIGTTSPSGVLDAQDNRGSLGATQDITAEFTRADGTLNPRLQIRHSTTGTDLHHTYSTGAGNFTFSNGGVEAMRIDSSGNVGIGITPAVNTPTKLTVAGDITMSGNSRGILGNLYFESGWKYAANGNAWGIVEGNGNLQFYNAPENSSGAGVAAAIVERMRIDSSGNVGIGTSSIASNTRLAVVGPRVGNDVGVGTQLLMNTSTTISDRLNINFSMNGVEARARAGIGAVSLDASGYNCGLAFYTRNAADGSALDVSDERVRITSSGTLLIGKTSPGLANIGHEFNPGGTASLTSNLPSTNEVFIYNQLNTAVTSVIDFRVQAVRKGSISYDNTSTSFNTTSDYRLKDDIQPMVGSVDRLMALKPVNFAWKVNGARVDGFLAHEAQTVVPEAVIGNKDDVDTNGNPVYQGIDQSKLVPLLTAALQEALQKIDSLEARIATLEGN